MLDQTTSYRRCRFAHTTRTANARAESSAGRAGAAPGPAAASATATAAATRMPVVIARRGTPRSCARCQAPSGTPDRKAGETSNRDPPEVRGRDLRLPPGRLPCYASDWRQVVTLRTRLDHLRTHETDSRPKTGPERGW